MRISKTAQISAIALLSLSTSAWAQRTGVSRPDETTVATPEPEVTPAPTAAPKLTATPRTMLLPETSPDARIVGDPVAVAAANEAGVDRLPARADADSMVISRVAGPANELPRGSLVKTSLSEALSTRGTAEGTVFQAVLTEAVERDGRVLLPAGAIVAGRVTEVRGGTRLHGGAALHLQPVSVTLPDGEKLAFHAQVIDTEMFGSTKVDREGTILRRSNQTRTAGTLALTAGSGAAAGGVFAGPVGALVGAGVGAGVSTVVWLRSDRQAELPAGTGLTFELTSALLLGR